MKNLSILLGLCCLLLACSLTSTAAQGSTADLSVTSEISRSKNKSKYNSFKKCLKSADGAYTSPPVLPGNDNYNASIKVFNPRFQPHPAAVVFAASTAEVVAAVKCAAQCGLKVSPSAGRQSFLGMSVQDGYVVIDVTHINKVKLSKNKKKLQVGAGIPMGMLQAAIHNISREADIPSLVGPTLGTCSWVGVAGYTLGGGLGWLSRRLGLGCDYLVSIKAVLADGSVVTANSEDYSDLLWASCGGGGGTFAIITRFDFKVHHLPNKGRVVFLNLKSDPGYAATVEAVMKFQAVLPTLDNRIMLDDPSLGGGSRPTQFTAMGVFLGTLSEAESALNASGLSGVVTTGKEYDSIYEAALHEVGPEYTALSPFKYTGPSPWQTQPWNGTAEQWAFLEGFYNGQPVQIVGGADYQTDWWYSQSRLMGIMTRSNVEAVVGYFDRAFNTCQVSKANQTEQGSWYCFASSGGHILGGKINDRSRHASAFVHRDKYWLLAAQFFVPAGQSDAVKQAVKAAADEYAKLVDAQLWPQPPALYANYLVPETTPESVWQAGYWGANYARLQKIKDTYDPDNLFGKPQTVQLPDAAY